MSPRNKPGVGERPDASGRSTLRGYNADTLSSSVVLLRTSAVIPSYSFYIIDRLGTVSIIA
jgi:hypothetical protein